MRTTFETMGTVASLELPNFQRAVSLVAAVAGVLEQAEQRFSLFRRDSELSQIADARLALTDASADLREAYEKAMEWRRLTDGAFTPNRPDGIIDLNGIAKAWAMDAAGRTLADAGATNWSLNVGGDVLCLGTNRGAPWTIAIVDPADRGATLCAVTLVGGRRAVATSGSAERGDHIWLGGSHTVPDFVQATVVADDIVTADVLATAIISGGRIALDDCTARWPIDVLTVDSAGELLATPGLRAALAA